MNRNIKKILGISLGLIITDIITENNPKRQEFEKCMSKKFNTLKDEISEKLTQVAKETANSVAKLGESNNESSKKEDKEVENA